MSIDAVVQTPSGKVTTAVCGSVFATASMGAKVSSPIHRAVDDGHGSTPAARCQAETTAACNPPK